MSTFFCKIQLGPNRFKPLLLLILIIFTLVEVQCASKSRVQDEGMGGGGSKDGVPVERVHGTQSIITFSRKRPPSGEYVIGVIRGIPAGGVTYVPITPVVDGGVAAAALGLAMPAVRPLQNIFNAANAYGFEMQVVDLGRTPAAAINGTRVILLNNPDHIDRLGYVNSQIIFRIWVPHGMTIGAALQDAIRAALVPPPAPLPLNIYFSGNRDTLVQDSAAFFSAVERRFIYQRVYENRYAVDRPISLPDNFYPGLPNAATQGLFRYNLVLEAVAFHRFWHTEPKFLYGLLNRRISPRGMDFLHNILAISKYPMCGLCSRLLLSCLLNDAEMGQINTEDRDNHFNIIIISNDLIGFSDTLNVDVRRVNNTIINNNLLSQASIALDNIGNLRARLELHLDPHLYTGINNWFMVLSN